MQGDVLSRDVTTMAAGHAYGDMVFQSPPQAVRDSAVLENRAARCVAAPCVGDQCFGFGPDAGQTPMPRDLEFPDRSLDVVPV